MDHKTYIAIIFVLIFFGKLAFLDAKLPGLILDASGISLVNKLCPKKQIHTNSPTEFATDDVITGLEIGYLCNTALDIEISSSIIDHTETNYRKYSYQVPGKFSVPDDRFYPPPKA
ncbi:hypothetical protein [Salinimicrobium sp. HB62]|uniref:hypothetical protein n=1 Tax=Salinimicrobium sp. HB62 TaxID=3077781 RepID=UPI002D7993FA|nr:hypothetical protein [Salinimicrobium sp. HB62]